MKYSVEFISIHFSSTSTCGEKSDQELQDKETLEINDIISQSELLHKLNIKTGFNFTKEELAKFKIKLEIVESNQETHILTVKLNIGCEVNNNWNWSRNFSEFQIQPKLNNKVNLLFNLYSGNLSMLSMYKYTTLMSKQDKKKAASFFPQLESKIEKIDSVIKEFITLSEEDKRTVHALLQTQQQWQKILVIEKIKKDYLTQNA